MSDNPAVEILDEADQLPATIDVSHSLAVGLTRAEINQQISTARAYPRSLSQVTKRIREMATLDEDSAEECMYALPRGGKPIKGPSIRFAEILQQSYGNCRAAARVVHVDRAEMFVEAEGVFHDLESNAATSARVRRRISDKRGRIFNDDMIIMTGNAACAIAKRNAILGGVPRPLWRKAYEAVQRTISGDVTTLTDYRSRVLRGFATYGKKPEDVIVALGLNGEEDITVDHVTVMRGMLSALRNSEATIEEMFSVKTTGPPSHKAVADPLSDKPPNQATATPDTRREAEVDPAPTGKAEATALDSSKDDSKELNQTAFDLADDVAAESDADGDKPTNPGEFLAQFRNEIQRADNERLIRRINGNYTADIKSHGVEAEAKGIVEARLKELPAEEPADA